MKVIWSIVLLVAVSLAIACAYFFGHALSVHDKAKWFGLSAVCLIASIALIFALVKFDHHTPGPARH